MRGRVTGLVGSRWRCARASWRESDRTHNLGITRRRSPETRRDGGWCINRSRDGRGSSLR